MQIIDYIFDSIDMQFYYWQQQLSVLISIKLSNINPFNFIIVLIAGVITSLNPCLLSILPLSLSYLYGNSNNKLLSKNKIMFLAGIISSLISMMFITFLFSKQYYSLIIKIPIFSSLFTIFIGLNLLQIINFYNFAPSFNNLPSFFRIQLLQNYAIGLLLGLNSIPCSTSIALIILAWLFSVKYWLLGYLYLFIYCSGYVLPLIIFVNWVFNNNQITSIIKTWNYIVPISGSCILGLGVFSLLENTFV